MTLLLNNFPKTHVIYPFPELVFYHCQLKYHTANIMIEVKQPTSYSFLSGKASQCKNMPDSLYPSPLVMVKRRSIFRKGKFY